MAATIYTLVIGGIKQDLTQSEKYIGIRPTQGLSKEMIAAVVATQPGIPPVRHGALGGFEIVEMDSEVQDVDGTLDQLRNDATVAAGTHIFHTSDDAVPFVPTGELYVVFDNGASDADMMERIDKQELELIEARGDNAFVLRITKASRNPLRVATALQEDDLVLIAEPELATIGKLDAVALPTDSLLSEQWHLRNTGFHRGTSLFFKEGADARVLDAWHSLGNLGSSATVVAVIDDGFDLTHPDIGGPGKVVHPFDFTRNTNDPRPGPGDWHGTACAGVAIGSARGGNIVGAAPNVSLMPVRWGRNLADRQIENWFGHVTERGADVVSCSWGAAANVFPLSTRAKLAIEKCAETGRNGKGCVIVFAAGNSNHDVNDLPNSLDGFATHPNVIAVAASNSRDMKSHYSNFGSEIWISAPSSGAGGAGILTADVTGFVVREEERIDLGYAPGDYTFDFGGTSSACPLVAGICALVLCANPDLTADEVKDVLRNTARRIGDNDDYDGNGHSRIFGYGCVDAQAAVERANALKSGVKLASAKKVTTSNT